MDTPRIGGKRIADAMSTPSSDDSDQRFIVTPGKDSPGGATVKEPLKNDVLCGRGGSINSHPGNERFRQLVEKRKRVYLTARFKREKRLIANSILSEIRSLDPPGRFLTRDAKTGTWYDIGDEKARDKTSQALRENAPSIRAEIEVEINQQRAEMQRAEEEEAARSSHPHGPPPPGYYQQPWGYYTPFYHGYGRGYHPEPPRYGHHDERYEQQWHGQYGEAGPRAARSPTAVPSRSGDASPHAHFRDGREHARHPPNQEGSAYDVSTYVSSIPSSIAAWTRTSLSFGGHSHSSEHERSGVPVAPTKPVPHIHKSHSVDHGEQHEGQRAVQFAEDHRSPPQPPHHTPYHNYNQRRHPGEYYEYSSPLNGGPEERDHSPPHAPAAHGPAVHPVAARPVAVHPAAAHAATFTPGSPESKSAAPGDNHSRAIEPHSAGVPCPEGEPHGSLLSQVANHILGSWDTSMVCANNSTEEPLLMTDVRPPSTPSAHTAAAPPVSLADAMDDDDEGQEVELAEMMDYEEDQMHSGNTDEVREDPEHNLMPPPGNMGPPPPRRIEIDWPSKMMGCQSNWFPETFNNNQGFFEKKNHLESPSPSLDMDYGPPGFFEKKNLLSPSASLEMDGSAIHTETTEGISCNESLGGASLVQVFSHDQENGGEEECKEPDSPAGGISQMSSWERSVRSKSPSTICSDHSV